MKTSRGVRSGDECANERGARRSAGLIVAGVVSIAGLFLGGVVDAQTTSSPAPSVHQPSQHDMAVEIVEKEAKALKAPTGFAGVKWLLNVDEVKALRPKARSESKGDKLSEEMEWLGRPATVTYGFQDGSFIIAIVTLLKATPEDYEKTQKYLQKEYGNMPAPEKTEEYVLRSDYEQGHFSIMHTLRRDKIEQVTIFRSK